jgi:hypothetical protein
MLYAGDLSCVNHVIMKIKKNKKKKKKKKKDLMS